MDRQCLSCGGFCKKSGCERENIAPTKREWQGLTDDDFGMFTDEFIEGALWAEAKLKEKNNA